MRKQQLLQSTVLIILSLALLISCRKEEDTSPTSTPTPVTEETRDGDNGVPEATPPAATPSPRPTATVAPTPIAAVDPNRIDWPPQLLYSSPAPGEETLLDGAITLRFDQPMDHKSVEDAFELKSADGEVGAVAGSFSWPRPDTMIFTPDGNYKRQQSYRLSVGQQASSARGFSLDEPLELFLQTVGYLKVSQVIPDNGVREIQTNSAVTVLFNRPVVPLVSSDQQSGLPQPLQLDPPVSGKGEWVSTSIYRFVPEEPLAGATAYDARVTTDFEDIAGGVLETEFAWRFATVGPDVVSIEPENGRERYDPAEPITITFNMPMERTGTQSAVSIRSAGAPLVRLSHAWFDGDTVLVITPQQALRLATSYQIGVAQQARAASGGATLVRDVLSGFTTVPFPAVTRTDPRRDQLAERWQRGISVNFASPMDWSTVEGRLRIEPDPGEVDYFFTETQVIVDFDLERNSEYRVTVPGDISDPYGNLLGQDYVWRFTTPPSDPVASLNLPQRISQVSTSFATRVDIIHRNVSRIDVALYALGLPLNILNEPYSINEFRPAADSLRTWEFPLETPREQAGAISLPLADGAKLPTGVYLITIDTPETDENVRFWQNQRHALIVADVNIVVKETFGGTHVWATDLASGRPVSGLNLVAYNEDGNQIGSATSDPDGFAQFAYSSEGFLSGMMVVSNRPGEPGFGIGMSRWDEGISPWQFGLNNRSSDERPMFAYIYTDRPIYRPGDLIHYKGIVRDANYGRYRIPTPQTVELTLAADSFRIEDGFEESFTVTLDDTGTFSGEYMLPDDASLGAYRISLQAEDVNASRTLSVAEYRKPEFLITLTPAEEQLLRGEPVDVVLEAAYFFGGPATDLEVNWRIYEESYSLRVPGPFYYFGDGANFFYEDSGFFFGGGVFGDFLIGGNARTDEKGQVSIALPANLLSEVEAGSRKVTIEASVNDLANFPVTTRTSVVMHAAESYVGIVPEDYISTVNSPTRFELQSVDWQGQPKPAQDVEVVFYQREWKRDRQASFGVYRTLWEPIDTEMARASVTTDAQGKGMAGFTPESGGIYIAVATVNDGEGRSHTSSATIWVADSRFTAWRTDPKERRMELVPDKQEYQPGDVARVLVQSPFAGPVLAWLTIERGTLLEQRLVTLNGSSEVVEIPIVAGFAPNVFVSLTAVKGVTQDDNPYADIRLGIAELVVTPAHLELNLSLTPREALFSPRETAVYDIRVTNYLGEPVQAELSLALVDLAVLTLKADNAPDIHDAFYERQPLRSHLGSGLFISGEGLEFEIPIEAPGMGGGGGGGIAEDVALSRAVGDDDEEIRRDFPDTAFWQAKVKTGSDGQAVVEIPLPDSLTTWRLSAKAISSPASPETLVGQSSSDVVVTLPLLVRPVTPRFLTAGDTLRIGAIVNNNSSQVVEAIVSLEASGLTLHDARDQNVTLPANGHALVQWQSLVNDVEFVDLTFRASGGGFADATKPTFGEGPDKLIPVYRYDAEDLVGTSGMLSEAGRRVEAILLPPGVDTRAGEVAIELSPSLAAALTQALQASNSERYRSACAHSITDHLLPNVATTRVIQELDLQQQELMARLGELVPLQIGQLSSLQKSDGGWGWCYSGESNHWLSAYALLALTNARNAGYGVDPVVLSSATAYVRDVIPNPSGLSDGREVNRQAFFLYVLAEAGDNIVANANALFDQHRTLLEPYARALLALAYEQNGTRGDRQRALLADLNNDVILSATGAHWEDLEPDYNNLNSDVRGTAIVVDALARIDPLNVLAPQAVRWLMLARQAQQWATGHETAWSINALSSWMAASGELEADYEYSLSVNASQLLEGSFTPANVTENERATLSMSQLATDEVNYLDFQRGLGLGRLYYTVYMDSFISANLVQATSRGIDVQRVYYDASCDAENVECQPVDRIKAGQRVRVELTIIAANDLLYAVIEDPIPAGAEAIDPGLETSAAGLGGSVVRGAEDYLAGYWGWWWFNRIEYRDEKVVFLSEFLPAGTYQYTYFLQTNIPGEYQVRPAIASQEFFPEVFGRSDGMLFSILE
jgi:uncharacterized protein YfaS (alpha-2-macroglobulin family)